MMSLVSLAVSLAGCHCTGCLRIKGCGIQTRFFSFMNIVIVERDYLGLSYLYSHPLTSMTTIDLLTFRL